MIPSLIFSFAYLLLFQSKIDFNLNFIYKIFNGVGHLWFLPMLFWCFLLTLLIERLGLKCRFSILITVILTLFSLGKLPLRINQSFNYILFFYIGFTIHKFDKTRLQRFVRCINLKNIIIVWSAYIFLVCTGILSKTYITDGSLIAKIIKFSYASVGVLAIFITTYFFTEIKKYEVPKGIIDFGNCCFGVYLLQEFIIRLIYYKTPASNYISILALPWLTCMATLVVSSILTKYFRKYKMGKLLLG
ncbi:MAG: acyltransferase [Muribaculum sp.]|nr:acyltransferase [Muribaculaceae bacterium]MCM1081311.1 acyltransferase [Muribaculum sp.]